MTVSVLPFFISQDVHLNHESDSPPSSLSTHHEAPNLDAPSHLLDYDTTLYADLRAPHTSRKRALSQAHRYHKFRAPALSPGLISQAYLYTPPRLHPDTYPRRGTANLTLDALIVHPETTVRTWTKKDMYLESLKPEFYWPKRPPHHYGRCRGCHNYWPHSKKGRRTMVRLRRERIDEGVKWWRKGWGVVDDTRVCEICDESTCWRYGGEVEWGRDGRPVIVWGLDNEKYGVGGGNGEEGVSDDEGLHMLDIESDSRSLTGSGWGNGGEVVSDDEGWDMLDSESDSRSSTGSGWEMLGADND